MADSFDIQWDGLKELAGEFKKMSGEFESVLTEEYTKYGKLVEEGMKALAPYDTGELIDKSSFDAAKRIMDGVEVVGGSSAKYALFQHEKPITNGVHPKYDNGAKFDSYYQNGRGLGTRKKPPWRGYQPGRKFLENAIKATEQDYNEMNRRILDRTLGDK